MKTDSGEQRRAFFRRDFSLPVRLVLFATPEMSNITGDRDIPVTMVNISAGGTCVEVRSASPAVEIVSSGSIVDISLALAERPLPLRVLGKIVRINKTGEGALMLGIEFILLSRDEADRIAKLVASHVGQTESDGDR
ncbi:PilZ domain-containing protein [bacterium]|nr:PilZ domain-containing protein [bacterium]